MKQYSEDSRGFPKEFIEAARRGVFIHKYPNLDRVLSGLDLVSRGYVEETYKDLVLLVRAEVCVKKDFCEGHVFLGAIGTKQYFTAYIEKIEGDVAYITSMSFEPLN